MQVKVEASNSEGTVTGVPSLRESDAARLAGAVPLRPLQHSSNCRRDVKFPRLPALMHTISKTMMIPEARVLRVALTLCSFGVSLNPNPHTVHESATMGLTWDGPIEVVGAHVQLLKAGKAAQELRGLTAVCL